MGRPPKQHHRIEIDLPGSFLGTMNTELIEGIPKTRVVGSIAAGAGAFLLVRVFQKTAGDILKELAGAVDFLASTLSLGFFNPGLKPTGPPEALIVPEPFAIAIGLVTAGMILADQNPGEILKGIGEIIPG